MYENVQNPDQFTWFSKASSISSEHQNLPTNAYCQTSLSSAPFTFFAISTRLKTLHYLAQRSAVLYEQPKRDRVQLVQSCFSTALAKAFSLSQATGAAIRYCFLSLSSSLSADFCCLVIVEPRVLLADSFPDLEQDSCIHSSRRTLCLLLYPVFV